jgi:HK97 family phage major capsid protein
MPVKIIEIADLAEDLVQVRDQLANDPANIRNEHRDVLARIQRQVNARINELDSYERLSSAQESERAQLDDFENEIAALKEQVDVAFIDKLDRVRAAAMNPRNNEAGATFRGGREDRTARAAGYSPISGRSPWDVSEMAWRSESMFERAHDAVASIERIPDSNREEIIESFADQDGHATARLAVALSDPAYLSAYRSMLRDPVMGGATLGPDERQALERVRQSTRAAMSVGTGSLGYAIPLVLDPTIILTNSGSANPFRQLASIKRTTAVTWNGVTSTGSSAGWYGEGAAIGDTSPTLSQLQITPQKAAVWVFGSWEAIGTAGTDGDVEQFTQQLPKIFADAKDQLEANTFATGAGTGAIPQGYLTAVGTGSDSTVAATGTRAASDLTGLIESLSPRFRGGDARNAFLASLTYLDKYRLTPAFSGANFPVVTDGPNGPTSLGTNWYEASAMTTGTAATSRVVAYGDWSQMYVVDRWPGFTLFEPMVKSTGALPTAQSGWLYAWRCGVGYTTTSAFKVLRLT